MRIKERIFQMIKKEEEVVFASEVDTGPDYGFVWVHPDNRETEEDAQKYLKKNPDMAINLGDGKGWRYGSKSNGEKTEAKVSPSIEKPKKERKKRKGFKKSKAHLIDTKGLKWEEKKTLISNLIKERYNEIPDYISFTRMPVRSGKDESYPDGTRCLVNISWLDRQRIYDNHGVLKIHRLWSKIDEYNRKEKQ